MDQERPKALDRVDALAVEGVVEETEHGVGDEDKEIVVGAGYKPIDQLYIQDSDRSLQTLFVQRYQGREPFPRRFVHIFKAILVEIHARQPNELQAVYDSAMMTMPRRMLQVLACLLAGYTVKETAELLGVSPHTVQEHVKRLYKRSGTKNRAELADCHRHVAPLLLGLSIDELPDYRQQVRSATRRPWPTESVSAAAHSDPA
jgi:DNA-binding CsgD family transcriptional regulator